MLKFCKGCGRQFTTTRGNVKFCIPDCAKVWKRIAWHQQKIADLARIREHIQMYGRIPPREENINDYFTEKSDAYPVANEGF